MRVSFRRERAQGPVHPRRRSARPARLGGARLSVEDEIRLTREVEAAEASMASARAAIDADPTDGAARRALRRAERRSRVAKGEWVRASAYLVVAIAQRYRRDGVQTMDLVQDGSIGLIRAVEKFDVRLGYRFHAYAAWWIRQHIFRAIADYGRTIRVPLPMLEANIRIARARRAFEGRHGRPPDPAELAALAGIEPGIVVVASALVEEPVSLHARIGDGDTELLDVLADRGAPPPTSRSPAPRSTSGFTPSSTP